MTGGTGHNRATIGGDRVTIGGLHRRGKKSKFFNKTGTIRKVVFFSIRICLQK